MNNDNEKSLLEGKLSSLEVKFATTVIKAIERINKELEEELNKGGELLSEGDKRFDRIRAVLNDVPKTIETMKLMKKTLQKDEEEGAEPSDRSVKNRNGKKIHNTGVEDKVAV